MGSWTGSGRLVGGLSRTVWVLGLASLFTDLSSDMMYPLLPAFLAVTLGAGAMGLGAMEGGAETLASLLKVASGALADRVKKRKGLVVAGYSLSGSVRPLIGLVLSWPLVMVLRLLDRVGKGIRTAPRDALIADTTLESMRGRAYGLHRAMDNAGAVFGPLVAALLLGVGLSIRQVFLSSAVPAVLVVVILVLGVRETPRTTSATESPAPTGDGRMGSRFWRLLAVVFVFALANSSDAFILLRLADLGVSPTGVTLVWTAHNVVRTAAVMVGGQVADRIDRRRLVAIGWALYVAIYLALALAESSGAVMACVVAYALHYGAVEAAERALVADLAPPNRRGSAFGWYHATVGFAALPASIGFGALWTMASPRVAFVVSAGLAMLALVGLVGLVPRQRAEVS